MQFIPRSVLMRSNGFVRNPLAKFMEDPWVVRPVIRDTSREDKIIAIFERFLAQWLKQSRRAREQSALKERTRRILERTVMVRDEDPEWTSVMEAHEHAHEHELARKPVAEFNAYARDMIAHYKANQWDILELIHEWHKIDRVREQEAVWLELSSKLHNKQKAAKVRRVVPRNRFEIDEDSE